MADDGERRGADPDSAFPQTQAEKGRMRFGLIGVPSSAGAHGPGQEKAPSALRKAGLLGALREAGLELEDLGDLPVVRFGPDVANRKRPTQSRVLKLPRHRPAPAPT